MPGHEHEFLVGKGEQAGAPIIVVLQQQAYNTLIQAVRIRMPAETIGLLTGKAKQAGKRLQTTICTIIPLELIPRGSGLAPNLEHRANIEARLAADTEHNRIVGWFYADPGMHIFPPRLDIVRTHETLAVGDGSFVLLLVNPSIEEGAFYIWSQDGFVPVSGFYEGLPERSAPSIVPWTGKLSVQPAWLTLATTQPAQPQPISATEAPAVASAEQAQVPAHEAAEAAFTPDTAPLASTQEMSDETGTGTDTAQDESTGPRQAPPAEGMPAPIAIHVEARTALTKAAPATPIAGDTEDIVALNLMMLGKHLAAQGNWEGALESYRYALALVPSGGGLATELLNLIQQVQAHSTPPADDKTQRLVTPGPEDEHQQEQETQGVSNVPKPDAPVSAATIGQQESPVPGIAPTVSTTPTGEVVSVPTVSGLVSEPAVGGARLGHEQPARTRMALLLLIPLALAVIALLWWLSYQQGGPILPVTQGAVPATRTPPAPTTAPTPGGGQIAETLPLIGASTPSPSAAPSHRPSPTHSPPTNTPLLPTPTFTPTPLPPTSTATSTAPSTPTPTSTPTPSSTPVPITTSTPTYLPPTATNTIQVTSTPAPPVAGITHTATPATSPISSTEELRQRVAAAESALRSGELQAESVAGPTSRSDALIRFDVAAGRMYMRTIYQGPQGTRTIERITIGDRTWQREGNGPWSVSPEQEGVWGRLQPYLPRVALIPSSQMQSVYSNGSAQLRWYNAGSETDVSVLFDPTSGVPLQLQQVDRTSGATLRITYTGWNTPVDIQPPPVQ